MRSNRLLTNLSYGLMKAGLMVFLFPFFWYFIGDSGVENSAGNITVSVVASILYGLLCFIIAVISRENFNLFGFMLVCLASIYQFSVSYFKMGINQAMAPYFPDLYFHIFYDEGESFRWQVISVSNPVKIWLSLQLFKNSHA
jgi:hypothetical protein